MEMRGLLHLRICDLLPYVPLRSFCTILYIFYPVRLGEVLNERYLVDHKIGFRGVP